MLSSAKLRSQPTRTPTMSIAQAKANFSSLITGVEQKHAPVTILRRGVPVAQIVPFPSNPRKSFIGSMVGTAQELGDIISPIDIDWTPGEWPEPDPHALDED